MWRGARGCPSMKRCDIHSKKSTHSRLLGGDIGAGALVFDSGAGRFEDCNSHENPTKDWGIRDGCSVQLRLFNEIPCQTDLFLEVVSHGFSISF